MSSREGVSDFFLIPILTDLTTTVQCSVFIGSVFCYSKLWQKMDGCVRQASGPGYYYYYLSATLSPGPQKQCLELDLLVPHTLSGVG